MTGKLEQLPQRKRDELARITAEIRKWVTVELIILYGSYARGDWVEDPVNEYMSDFDLLVVVASPELAADHALWFDCQQSARNMSPDTLVCIIAESVGALHRKLAKGFSFYRDVVSEGIALYDAGRVALPTIEPLTTAQRYMLAETACGNAFLDAALLLEHFDRLMAQKRRQTAAFTLHQTAEMLYKAISVVFQGYLPKTHDLAALDAIRARVAPEIEPVIPNTVPNRSRLAGLLNAAYVDARYNSTFRVTRDELSVLGGLVRSMLERTEHACRAHLAILESKAHNE